MEAGNTSPLADWDFWSQGLDKAFFKRVYKRALQVGAAAALVALGLEQRGIAFGLVSGLAVGLSSAWTVEVMVRLLFNGGGFAGLKLAIGALIKLPFMLAGLMGIAWASYNGFMNIFAVVAGVLLVHGTMLVLVVSTAAQAQERSEERRS